MSTVPVSGTNITLLQGIPFSNDYKNQRWFDNITDQNNYFNSKTVVHAMTQANFQRIDGYHYIKVDERIDNLLHTNYLMFQNASYGSKWFYAFVTNVEYKNPNCTYVYFELDVFQTWLFDMNFKPSYVLREHCPLWNSDNTPIINTVPEGLNYGTEYDVVSVDKWKPFKDIFFLVIVSKTLLHGTQVGTYSTAYNAVVNPLCYYVQPIHLDGSIPNCTTDGTNDYTPTLADAQSLLFQVFTNVKTVNDIVSIYLTDFIGATGITYTDATSTINFQTTNYTPAEIGTAGTFYVSDITNYYYQYSNIGNVYDNFETVTESKLFMHPYCLIELTDFKGNHVTYKPEYIYGNNLTIYAHGSIGSTNKTSYRLENYLTDNLTSTDADAVSLNHALINNSPNDIPVLVDYLSAFIQGHKNSLQNERQTIAFNGVADEIGHGIGGLASAVSENPMGVASSVTGMIKGMGNTVQRLKSINAKIKDISNHPPSLAKMGNNSQFDYGNGYSGVYLIKKQIKPEYRKKLQDFFNMFGYKLNEVKIPNFHTRQNWNYIQTESCTITGNFNNQDLNTLKSLFNNGITLWHTDDIGNYSLSNGVI